MNFKHSIKKGFTLVELLIVIAIIAILSAVVGINAFKSIEKSKVSRTLNDVKVFKTAALQYYADVGNFPVDVTQGKDPGFYENISDNRKWNGPYLEQPLSKPTAWGSTYDYEGWGPNVWRANKVSDGIYISVHGLSEENAKSLAKQSSFEVVNGENGPIQTDDVNNSKKKVTFKIADWPNK